MKLVACEIFRQEMEIIAPEIACRATWLPAGLHVNLDRLKAALETALEGTQRTVCLYGACHPEIDDLLGRSGGCRLPGKDCVAAFLPEEKRREYEARRAFVMTPGWLRHWREIFRESLGWDEVDARQNFGFYDIVILLDFGLEMIDDMDVLEFFEFIQKPVEIVPADPEQFRRLLLSLVEDTPERGGAKRFR
jgi:hypothetical protein